MKRSMRKLADEISLMRLHLHHLVSTKNSLHDSEIVNYSQMLDEKLNAFYRLSENRNKRQSTSAVKHII